MVALKGKAENMAVSFFLGQTSQMILSNTFIHNNSSTCLMCAPPVLEC